MRNTWNNNNNNQAKSSENTVQFGKDRKKALALLKTVRPIREILKNHKNGKISNNEKNKQLENRVELNKQKRIHWLTKKERKQAKMNRLWKRNAAAGLNELLKNIGSTTGIKTEDRVDIGKAVLKKIGLNLPDQLIKIARKENIYPIGLNLHNIAKSMGSSDLEEY